MKRNSIIQEIDLELRRIKKVSTNYPDHVAAQAGIVCAESGKLMDASLNSKYYHGKKAISDYNIKKMRRSAIATAAKAIRFLENLKSES